MRVRVKRAYGQFSVGAIIPDMPGNVARTMIHRGLVEEVIEHGPDQPAESRAMESPVNRMMGSPFTRKGRTQEKGKA